MTTTTSTYSSPILSSFTANPLTTTFTPAATCSGAYSSNGVLVIDEDTSACLPTGFLTASTDYFSPGLVCPSGYWTACHDNAGVSTITTVTCCPFRGDISLGCVTPSTLSKVWETLFCTWIAPADGTTVSITLSGDGTTSTAAESVSSPGGLNALGIRMVYEASDLSTITTSSSSSSVTATTGSTSESDKSSVTGTSSTSTATGTATGTGNSGGSTISTGVTVAIAVILSVVGIGVVIGVFLWMRKRKQKQQYGAVGPHSPATTGAWKSMLYEPQNVQELSGVGSQGVRNRQHELAELAHNQPVELPASMT